MKLDYNLEKVKFTKKSVEALVVVNPRRIRKVQVDSLYQQLMKGKHFDSCLVVNNNSTKTRVIDGQHRIEAMRLYFNRCPDDRIEIAWASYHGLTPNQEREIYRKWNISIKQSTDDFINSYRETIPMFERLTTDIPCSIYGSKNKMRLRDLINAYLASSEIPYKGGEKKTTFDFVKYMQNLSNNDVDIIIKHFEVIKEVFNKNGVKDFMNLSAFKNVIFRAIYYLVANNSEILGETYIIRRMKTTLVNRSILDEYRRYYGRRASVDAYLAFRGLLNDTASEKQFI